jgi:energy-coupling factor transporter ATP-binding protein EcfA2
VRLNRLLISNFRGISSFEIADLATMVVIAGPNGCGKSSVFDAIRLVKSVYGGYQQDEWRSWFGEFQINLSRRDELAKLFRDTTQEVRIEAVFELADSELAYLSENAAAVIEPLAWREVAGRDFDYQSYGSPALATELRVHGDRVREIVRAGADDLRTALDTHPFVARLVITPELDIEVEANRVLELLFQVFDPGQLGIIDYHGPSRSYEREVMGGLTLNLESFEQRRRNQSPYNWREKYRNVKTELGANYVRDLIATQAGVELEGSRDLNRTLTELFQTFFPDKHYEGPRPTREGTPEFPVHLVTGEEHDIDDLSSGEKELLYGYLRLRDSAPQNSVILG